MAGFDIREVYAPAGLCSFVGAAGRASACDPCRAEPWHPEPRWAFDPRRSPLVTKYEVHDFVTYLGEVRVGRIATSDNPSFLDRHRPGLDYKQGLFGLSINSERGLLVAESIEPARKSGVKMAIGPMHETRRAVLNLVEERPARPVRRSRLFARSIRAWSRLSVL